MVTIDYNSYVTQTNYLINDTFNETLRLQFKSIGCLSPSGSLDYGCMIRASCESATSHINHIYFLLVIVPFIVYFLLWALKKIDNDVYDNFNTSYDIVREEILLGGFTFIACAGAVLIWYGGNFDYLYNMVMSLGIFYGVIWILRLLYAYYKKKYIV